MASTEETSTTRFWLAVRSRRNHFYFWWLAWLPFGFGSIVLYDAAFGGQPPMLYMMACMLLWLGCWVMLAVRLSALKCPRCSCSAIAHPMFFMRHARCRHCGLQDTDAHDSENVS